LDRERRLTMFRVTNKWGIAEGVNTTGGDARSCFGDDNGVLNDAQVSLLIPQSPLAVHS
jgi:hypothetical protein